VPNFRIPERGRRFSRVLLALLPLSLGACDSRGASDSPPPEASASAPAPGPRSIVLFTIDALRADHLGCYGYPRATTPRIDELAQRGLIFEQAVAQWPKTAPSMASLMTSTYGSTSGVARTTLDRKVPRSYELFAEVLHHAGWETLGVVANMSLTRKFNFEQGFERFSVASDNTNADHVAGLAKELLQKRDRKRPWFLWIHFLDPHAPYTPPDRFKTAFVGDEPYERDQRPAVPVDPRVRDPSAQGPIDSDLHQIPAYAYIPGKDRVRDYVTQYDGDIRFLDEQLGELIDWMRKERHLDSRTLLAFTADHGESLGDHDYYFEHGRFPYDDCVRVPLILVGDEWKPGRVASPVGLIDLAPTLLELVELAPGWQFQGQSLVPWIRGGAAADVARSVFTESGYLKNFEVSVRRGRWKLIKVGTPYMARMLGGTPYELYDVLADPGETKNLFDEMPPECEPMMDELDAYVRVAYQREPPPDDGDAFVPDAAEQEAMQALGYADDKKRAEQGDCAEPPKKDDGGG
jgi:arylsulfatase A-like enzyme